MLVVTTNLTYVDNGIIAEVMASDSPNPEELGAVPVMTPKIQRRVFVEREEALKFVTEEIARYHPAKGDMADILVFPGDGDTVGNA